jgi:3-dehydroquinate synthase
MIRRSLEIKAQVVQKDETETSLRAILNYGHTLGHAIEMLTGFSKVKHGEAVAMGMAFAAKLSYVLGRCRDDVPRRISEILKNYELPYVWPELPAAKYIAAVSKDKKASSRNIKFILPKKIGKVDIVPLPAEVIRKCL